MYALEHNGFFIPARLKNMWLKTKGILYSYNAKACMLLNIRDSLFIQG